MMANFEQGVRAINDMSQEEIIPVSAQILQQLQVKACLGVPILLGSPPHKDREFLPSLDKSEKHFDDQGCWLLVAHQCSGARDWQPLEVDLLKQLGNQVAIAIQQANFTNSWQRSTLI
jgi:GAF domain-containing protein